MTTAKHLRDAGSAAWYPWYANHHVRVAYSRSSLERTALWHFGKRINHPSTNQPALLRAWYITVPVQASYGAVLSMLCRKVCCTFSLVFKQACQGGVFGRVRRTEEFRGAGIFVRYVRTRSQCTKALKKAQCEGVDTTIPKRRVLF